MFNTALYLASILGVFAAAFLVARSPVFWIGLAKIIITNILPIILKRMPPEDEKAYNDLMLSGASKDEMNQWERDRIKRRTAREKSASK